MKKEWYLVAVFFTALLMLVSLSSCGEAGANFPGNVGAVGPQGPTGNAGPQGAAGQPYEAPTPTPVEQLVINENAYRLEVGQEQLIPGLVCTLYTVPNTTTQIIGAIGLVNMGSFEYLGSFNQANTNVTVGLNVLPATIQPIFQTWYILKCTGSLVISDDNWHGFSLSSDDGANLYIDGLLINNDGLHGIQTATATKFLKYGFHSFELDFLQASGQQALILNEDGAIMGDAGFYH